MDFKHVALVALALLSAAPVARGADGAAAPRLISVSGEAQVSATPDRARLQLGVTQLSPDLRAAEKEVNRIVRDYLAAAKAQGASAEQIGTTGMSIQPEYTWDEATRSQKLTGYRVSRDIALRLDSLDKLGDYLLKATEVGINQIQPPVLESSRAAEFERQALADAARDAKARASVLATTLDARLGALHSLNAVAADAPQPVVMQMAVRAKAESAAADDLGLSAGQIQFQARVTADFELQ